MSDPVWNVYRWRTKPEPHAERVWSGEAPHRWEAVRRARAEAPEVRDIPLFSRRADNDPYADPT